MVGQHLLVVDEPAGREHDAAVGTQHPLLAVLPGPHPDHPSVLDDEAGDAGVDDGAYAGLAARRRPGRPSAPCRRRRAPAGRWPRGAGRGERCRTASCSRRATSARRWWAASRSARRRGSAGSRRRGRPASRSGRRSRRSRRAASPRRRAGPSAACRNANMSSAVSSKPHAFCTLGAAAEVELAAGQGRGAAGGAGPLEDEHASTGLGGRDGRAGSGDAEPHDEDVDVVDVRRRGRPPPAITAWRTPRAARSPTSRGPSRSPR